MKVLHVIDHMGLGGAQRLVHDLVETRAADVEASVCALRRRDLPGVAERFAAAGVPYRALASFSLDDPFGPLGVRALIRETRPEVLHLCLEYSALFGTLSALSLPAPRPSVVVTVANDPQRHARLPRWIAPLLASQVDLHLVLSPSVRDALVRAYPRHRRVEIVYPGVDLARFDRARANADTVSAYRRGARRVVGTMARLATQKALHVLLDATPLLLRDDPETRVLIVGSGPLRDALERRAQRLGIAPAVTFAGYQEDVVSAFAAMDVFALPSRDEGYALVFMEAMAMGVPVVGTRVIGSIDAVEDGVTGLRVPYDDAPALAQAVLRILHDTELRQRLCATASERARESYARERYTARFEALCRELTAR